MFLGFLKGFPSKTVGYISCGTGFAGIFATATLLICKAIPITNQVMFFIVCPTVFLYYYCFSWLVNQTKKYEYVEEGEDMLKPLVEEVDGDSIVKPIGHSTSG